MEMQILAVVVNTKDTTECSVVGKSHNTAQQIYAFFSLYNTQWRCGGGASVAATPRGTFPKGRQNEYHVPRKKRFSALDKF